MIIALITLFISLTILIYSVIYQLNKKVYNQKRFISKRVEEFARKTTQQRESKIPFVIKNDQLSQIPWFNRVLEKFNVSQKLQRLLDQAGSSLKVGNLILRMVILGLAGFTVTLITDSLILKIITVVSLSSLPLLQITMQSKSRLKAFIREFPDTIDMMKSAIQAGHAFNQAIQLVGNESPDPIGVEFKKTFEQYNLGIDLREALLRLSERINSLDLKLFVTAVLLQRETGGNLTEILEKISYTIRERFKLMGQIKTYTAQGRMSAWIIGLLPIIFILLISTLNPNYLTPLFHDKIGHYLILLATLLQVIGFLVVRKIVKIKYQ